MEERGRRHGHDGQSQGQGQSHGRRSALTLTRRTSVHSLHDVDADVYQYQDPGADGFSDAEAGELGRHSNRDGRSMTTGTESRTGARVRVRASTSMSPSPGVDGGAGAAAGESATGIHQPTVTATSSQELRNSKERQRQRQAARQLSADLANNQHAKNLKRMLRMLWILLAGMTGWLGCMLYSKWDSTGTSPASEVFSIFRDIPSMLVESLGIQTQKVSFFQVIAEYWPWGDRQA